MEHINLIIKVPEAVAVVLNSMFCLTPFRAFVTGFSPQITKTGLPGSPVFRVLYAKYRWITIRKKIMAYIFRFAAQ
jgi:hypothetical protein